MTMDLWDPALFYYNKGFFKHHRASPRGESPPPPDLPSAPPSPPRDPDDVIDLTSSSEDDDDSGPPPKKSAPRTTQTGLGKEAQGALDDAEWRLRLMMNSEGDTAVAAGSRNPFDDSLPRQRRWRGRQKSSTEVSPKTVPQEEEEDDDLGELPFS